MKKVFLLIVFFFVFPVKAETCISVNGLQFEKIGRDQLLIIQNGTNIGTLQVWESVPDGSLTFRFFTPTICTGNQNEKFQINGILLRVQNIEKFK